MHCHQASWTDQNRPANDKGDAAEWGPSYKQQVIMDPECMWNAADQTTQPSSRGKDIESKNELKPYCWPEWTAYKQYTWCWTTNTNLFIDATRA
jgi:hypothetical protein